MTRALERILSAQAPTLVDRTQLMKGRPVLVYYKSSKQNEPSRWQETSVESAEEHMVMCKKSSKGTAMTVTYEDIRLLTDSERTREIMMMEAEDDDDDDTHSAEQSEPYQECVSINDSGDKTARDDTGKLDTHTRATMMKTIEGAQRVGKEIGDTVVRTEEAAGEIN